MPQLASHFQVDFQDPSNKDCFATALEALAQKIIAYAELLKTDRNSLISDANFILSPEDYMKRGDAPVSVHIAELMSQKAAPKPAKKHVAEVIREEEEPETPEVKVGSSSVSQYNEEKALAIQAEEAAQEKAAKTVVTVKSAPVAVTPVTEIIDKIFENLKRTGKSLTIVTAFAEAGKEMGLEELMTATKLSKNDICSWLNQTGKSVKAIVKTARGIYKLDPDKV